MTIKAKSYIFHPMKKTSLKPYLFLLPALILALVFVYSPFISSIISSFFNVRIDGSLSSFVGLANYIKVFHNEIFTESFMNTFRFMIIFVPLNIILIMAAVLPSEKDSKTNRVFQTVFMLPMAIGMSSIALIFKYMFRPSIGIINRIIGVDIQWTNDATAAMFSLVFLGIFLDFGLDYLLLLSSMKNLNKSVSEAAMLDGANAFQSFTRIKLPLISPTLFFVLFISIKDALLICAPVMVMTEGGPFRSTQTIVYYYYIEAFRNSNYASAAAISTLVFILAALITLASSAIDRRRVHYQ